MMKYYPKNIAYTSVILVALLLFCFASQGSAETQESPQFETGKVVLTWSEIKTLLEEIETLKQEKAETERERAEKEEQARTEKEKQEKEQPPLNYLISKAEFEGTVEEQEARFEARIDLQILQPGWTSLPLLPNNAALETVEILTPGDAETQEVPPFGKAKNHREAQLTRDEQGYSLLAKGAGPIGLKLVLRVPLQREKQRYTLAFQPPAAVINRVELRIPEEGVSISEMLPAGQVEQEQGRTTIRSVLSQSDSRFQVSWDKETDGGVFRKSLAQVNALLSLDQSALLVTHNIRLEHLNSLESVELRVPSEVEILHLSGQTIERWSAEPAETYQRITFSGQLAGRKPVDLTLSYQLRVPELPVRLPLPAMQIHGVDAYSTVLGIEVAGNLEMSPEALSHGLEIPVKRLPAQLWEAAVNPLLHGYEFHSNEFSVMLQVKQYEEIQPVLASVELADYLTQRTNDGNSVTRALYAIRNNNRQFLTLTLPEGSTLWQAFLEGEPIKAARKESGEILIPMKKSLSRDEQLQVFLVEIGYISKRAPFDIKGVFNDTLPALDLAVQHLRWTVHLPENYEYTNLEGNLRQVPQFSRPDTILDSVQPQIAIPAEGRQFRFEKSLLIAETPHLSGEYGRSVITNIDLVDCVTHRTLEGKSMTRVQYLIRNNERHFFTLRLPPKSRIWQAFLDGNAIDVTRTDDGGYQIPLLKSMAQGEELEIFSVEIGYITEVDKFSLKGEMLNELPRSDLPIGYLRWTLYLPEDYEYSRFEGALKQVSRFSESSHGDFLPKPDIQIPTQGKQIAFEKYLVVNETPSVRGKYRQQLGDDLYLSLRPQAVHSLPDVTPRAMESDLLFEKK